MGMLQFKIPLRTRILLTAISVLVLVISAVVFWNTFRLQREIDERTQWYVSDLASQIAIDVDDRLLRVISDLESIGNTLVQSDFYQSDSGRLHEYLTQKAQSLGFSSMLIVFADGTSYQPHLITENLLALPGIQASLAGENGVSFYGEQRVLFSVPIMSGGVIGVLGGVCDKDDLQTLIQPNGFSGEGLACIIDQDGSVVLSPDELAPYTQLRDLFLEDPDDATAQRVKEMEEDISAHRAGVFRFETAEGMDFILFYHPLRFHDWVLLTLVPGNILSKDMDQYIHQTFIIMVAVVVLMAVVLVVLIFSQKAHYRAMEKLAFVDRLTGAMNGAAFRAKCEELFPKSPPDTYSVVFLNIKNFKLLNTRFGRELCDQLLRKVMEVLQTNAGTDGFAARAEADTFYLCLKEGRPEPILQTVDKVLADAAEEIRTLNTSKNLSVYFVLQPGVCIVDDPATDILVIQDRAKIACRNRTSSEDGACKFFDAAIIDQMERAQELNGLFADSLANGDFRVYLQPKVWVGKGTIGGAEALVRWQHPQEGMIFPSDFIPLFESNGNICRLDLYVFEEVCKTIRRWMDEGKGLVPVSVNLSRQHFQRADSLQPFAEIAQRYRIPEEVIEFELTESIMFDDQGIEDMKGQIRRMHELGFLCSLDDFGSDYSSLRLLMEFNVDAIKLDRRFFKNVENPKVKAMVASIVEISHKLGALTVAEGIETPEQLALLKEVGCDMVQGYIYARPMPIPEFEAWEKNHEK